MTPPSRAVALDALVLNASDPARLHAFYVEALGFTGADASTLQLGGVEVRLMRAAGRPYPTPMHANDLWFQHFAIEVADMALAFATLSRHAHTPISHGGPQQLPPSTGSVVAYKFRDPEGHPLELFQTPSKTRAAGPVFVGINHTAMAVQDLEAGVRVYQALGFRDHQRLLNHGPAQARLDGLDGARVDIAVMTPPGAGPHIELLHYRAPLSTAPLTRPALDDVAATRTVLAVNDPEASAQAAVEAGARPAESPQMLFRDPDGHFIELAA